MRRYLLLGLLVLPVLAGCGSTTTIRTVTKIAPASNTSPSATTATTTIATATATSAFTPPAPVYFEGAVAGSHQRPASLELTGDGTLAVMGVQWTSWGGPTATGSGNAEYHGCTPNCAQAPVHTALVSIHLSGVRVCSGRRYYSGVALVLGSGQSLDKSFLRRSWSPC